MKSSQGILNNQTIYLCSAFSVLWAAPILIDDCWDEIIVSG